MDPSSIILLVLILIGVVVIASRSRSLKHKNIGAPPPDLWRDYRSALDGYEQALGGLSYRELPLPSAPFWSHFLSAQTAATGKPSMDVLMPQLGETVAEGKITQWFKAAGEAT
jgi:hypothetical protein